MIQKISRTIGICAAVALVVATFARGGVAGNYVNLPRSPNLEERRTIKFPIKGVVVYITPEESARLDWIGLDGYRSVLAWLLDSHLSAIE